MVWRAVSSNPAIRKGLPFLPSFRLGKRLLVRIETRRKWLKELEDSERQREGQGT
jgi:hypothetical protein